MILPFSESKYIKESSLKSQVKSTKIQRFTNLSFTIFLTRKCFSEILDSLIITKLFKMCGAAQRFFAPLLGRRYGLNLTFSELRYIKESCLKRQVKRNK
jgi:hypothetical protein